MTNFCQELSKIYYSIKRIFFVGCGIQDLTAAGTPIRDKLYPPEGLGDGSTKSWKLSLAGLVALAWLA